MALLDKGMKRRDFLKASAAAAAAILRLKASSREDETRDGPRLRLLPCFSSGSRLRRAFRHPLGSLRTPRF